MRDDLQTVNWQDLFFNLNANEKGLVFTDVFMDIMAQRISNRIITCNDKDARWITSEAKTAIKRNSRVYWKCVNRGRNPQDQHKVREARNSANKFIKEAKLKYYANLGAKLSDPNIGQKHFWTAYKKLANKKSSTNIPPIINDGLYISNCKQKAHIFNVLSMIMAVSYQILFLKPM